MTLLDFDMGLAACGGADPQIFHNLTKASKAKRICGSCPVLDGCREATLQVEKGWAVNSRASVFGGMTPSERFAEDRNRWPEIQIRKPIDHAQRRAVAS